MSRLDVIHCLARAAEFRDDDTGQHVIRVGRYARVIGQQLGFSPQELDVLEPAAQLHDVGKIGIADSILLKPGKLTQPEFLIMQEHTTIGAELLSGHHSTLLKVARFIALTHHERWDGGGYPKGLREREIPLAGRITALCDVFDALTSPRPYKEAWPFEQAVHEIWRGKGSHFDPRLVDCFMQNLPTIKQIYGQNHTPARTFN
jgi:putative two-component system response regulator